jgi:AcrR family transcriptional regulator
MTTRDAILDASTHLFAEQGFRDTSVREICRRADANIAAINYHFGNKAALYGEVVARAFAAAGDRAPMPTSTTDDEPASALAAWIAWYIDRLFGKGSDVATQLVLREAAAPTATLDALVESQIMPFYSQLERLVLKLLPLNPTPATTKLHCLSILGQCLMHRTNKPMIDRLHVEPKDLTENLDRMAAHITRAAIAALRAERTQ